MFFVYCFLHDEILYYKDGELLFWCWKNEFNGDIFNLEWIDCEEIQKVN